MTLYLTITSVGFLDGKRLGSSMLPAYDVPIPGTALQGALRLGTNQPGLSGFRANGAHILRTTEHVSDTRRYFTPTRDIQFNGDSQGTELIK